jgi:hypothetical protein
MTRTHLPGRLVAAAITVLLATVAVPAAAAATSASTGASIRTAAARAVETVDPRSPAIQDNLQQPLNAVRVNSGGEPVRQNAALDVVAGAWARQQAEQRTAVPDPALASTLPRSATRSAMGVYVTTHHDDANAAYALAPQLSQLWSHEPWTTDVGVGIAVERGPGGTNRYTVVLIAAGYPHSTARPGELTLYRFYRPDSGTHFYTTSAAERDKLAGMHEAGGYWYEGPVGFVLKPSTAPAGTRELTRFYRPAPWFTGTHFYTSSQSERDRVLTLPQYRLDGVAAAVHTRAGAGLVPMYRFFRPGTGTHFYTTSAAEVERVKLVPEYQFEGVAFYVRPAS